MKSRDLKSRDMKKSESDLDEGEGIGGYGDSCEHEEGPRVEVHSPQGGSPCGNRSRVAAVD